MSLPRFGVTNPVPVNLLMMAFLIAGFYSAVTIQREFFPEISPEAASVTLVYPGATPEEVEEGLAIKVEDRLAELQEVERLTTTLTEGGGGIVVEFRDSVRDVYRATDEVQRAIDQLMDLPEDAERIRVTEFEPRLPVIMVTLYGDAEESAMKRAIRGVRDDLQSLSGMGELLISGVRDFEIRVDVRHGAVLEYGISLPEITDAIRQWMREVPGGTVRSDLGTINVRVMGVEERAEAIREIVVRGASDGTVLRVADLADVTEDFEDVELSRRFNGQRAVSLTVFKVGDQDIVSMAEMARSYVEGRNGEPYRPRGFERAGAALRHLASGRDAEAESTGGSSRRRAWELGVHSTNPLPPGTQLATQSDLARFVEGRLALLGSNAFYGAILVFLTLLLFLNWRVAFWVGVGLTTVFAGTLVFMEMAGITLNLLTMFGLIVVLGLLVDDAIVVAENIQARHDQGEPSLPAAIKGAEQVSWPVVATVLTSIVAFLPLSFIKGSIGDLLGALPLVVTCALIMSLIESLLILPSHMGHSLAKRDKLRPNGRSFVQRYEEWRDHLILEVVVPAYARLLALSLKFRYISLSIAIASLVIVIGMIGGGLVPYTFLTSEDSETIIVDIRMPIGTPTARTEAVVARFEEAAAAQPETLSISAIIGERSDIDTGQTSAASTHLAQMFIELLPTEQRDRESARVVAAIRNHVGVVEEAERIAFSEITGGPGGPDITIRVRGNDEFQMREAIERIKAMLRGFDKVYDIADDESLGQRELQFTVRPEGAALGFTGSNIANQVRGVIFGLDAHTFAAEQEDIDVRIRLDEATRGNIHAIEQLWVISPQGRPVPLVEIADMVETTGYTSIRRIDRQRAITVTADTDPDSSPEDIVRDLNLDELRASFPRLSIELGGRQEQQADAFATLPIGFLAALIMIYVILAWLFANYIQPIVVMFAIPFGLIGVVLGHLLLGFDMTFLSLIGFVALSGVIVNDSLILVKFYNSCRANGMALHDSLIEAGRKRLRPIFLTTVTTVLGLTPLMLEQSFQARFLIPMAISIAFGLMGATIVILLVLPCLLVIVDDLKRGAYYLWFGEPRPEPAVREAPAEWRDE